MTDFDTVDFYTDESVVADPFAYFAHLRAQCPVVHLPEHDVMAVTTYDDDGRRAARPRDVLVVQRRGRAVPRLLGQARALRRHQRVRRAAPRRAADERVRGGARRRRAPRPARAGAAPLHAEAHAGERGVHVGARRSPDRRVHRHGQGRGAPRLRLPLRPAGHRRPARRSGGGPPRVPQAPGRPAPGRRRRPTAIALDPLVVPAGALRRVRRGPPPRAPRATCSRNWPPPPTPTVRSPTSTPCAAWRRSCSRPGRTPPPGSSPRRCGSSPRIPRLQAYLRADFERIPNFVEEVLRYEGVVKQAGRTARVSTTIAGVDIPAGIDHRPLPPGGQPRPGPVRGTRRVPSRPPRTPTTTWPSGAASTPAPAGRCRASRPGSASSGSSPAPTDIRLDESVHGPAGDRHFEFEPIYILHGLKELHLELTPAG